MNTKVAKRLRKEAMFHPSEPREYVTINNSRKFKQSGGIKEGTIQLTDDSSRTLYNELKKEYYEKK